MIVGVVVLARGADIAAAPLASDYASRAAVAASRGWHGILTIIASRLRGQASFEITKSAAVFARIRKWPTLLDQTEGMHSLWRQLGHRDARQIARFTRLRRSCQSTDQHGQQQQSNESGYFLHGQLALANLKLRFDFLTQADMQFPQLLLVYAARRIGEQALRTLGFRESDHVTD